MYSDGFYPMSSGMPTFMVIFMIIFFCFFIFIIFSGISQWDKNNKSPTLSVNAKMVTKRTNVTHTSSTGTDDSFNTSTSTSYYATFEVESGDRLEFYITGREFGMLVEGDMGTLTFQGTRYKGFVLNNYKIYAP